METPENIVATIKSELWFDTSHDGQYIAVQTIINLARFTQIVSAIPDIENTLIPISKGMVAIFSWHRRWLLLNDTKETIIQLLL